MLSIWYSVSTVFELSPGIVFICQIYIHGLSSFKFSPLRLQLLIVLIFSSFLSLWKWQNVEESKSKLNPSERRLSLACSLPLPHSYLPLFSFFLPLSLWTSLRSLFLRGECFRETSRMCSYSLISLSLSVFVSVWNLGNFPPSVRMWFKVLDRGRQHRKEEETAKGDEKNKTVDLWNKQM